jgi:hypothetical protein
VSAAAVPGDGAARSKIVLSTWVRLRLRDGGVARQAVQAAGRARIPRPPSPEPGLYHDQLAAAFELLKASSRAASRYAMAPLEPGS